MSFPHTCPYWKEQGNPLFLWVRAARERAKENGTSPVFYLTETLRVGMLKEPRWYVIQEVLKRFLRHRRLTVHQHNDIAKRLLRRYGGNHWTESRVILKGFGYAYVNEHGCIASTVDEYDLTQNARGAFYRWWLKMRKSDKNPFDDVWDEQNATLIMLQEAKCVVSHPNRELRRLRNESAKDDGRTVRSTGEHHGRGDQRGCEA